MPQLLFTQYLLYRRFGAPQSLLGCSGDEKMLPLLQMYGFSSCPAHNLVTVLAKLCQLPYLCVTLHIYTEYYDSYFSQKFTNACNIKCLFHQVLNVFHLLNCLKQGQFALFCSITAMDGSKRGEGCPKPMGIKISRTTLVFRVHWWEM